MLGFSRKLLMGSFILLMTISGTQTARAFETFTSQADWEAALSSTPTTFDFSGLAGSSVPSGTVLPNGLSVSYIQSNNGSAGFTGVATNTGLSFTRANIQTGLSLNLGFPSPVEAFGFNLSPSNFLAVQVPSVSTQPFFPTTGFFGFIADPGASLSRVTIDCAARATCVGVGTVNVNNISVVPAAKAVSEPSATFAFGFLVTACFALRRQFRRNSSLL